MIAQALANKFRRAIRNDTGTSLSADELRQLGEMGVIDLIIEQEREELSVKWAARNNDSTPWAGSGSPSARNRHSSRSAGMTNEQRLLAARALVAGR